MLGTIVGVVASIAVTAAFSQTSVLYLVTHSVWLGLCIFFATFLDGNRAYGAVLCGYTVSIVAVGQIDNPARVFSVGINRGAAVLIGIASISFVDALFFAPNISSAVIKRVHTARCGYTSL